MTVHQSGVDRMTSPSSPSKPVAEKITPCKSTCSSIGSNEDCEPSTSTEEYREILQLHRTSSPEPLEYNQGVSVYSCDRPKTVVLFGETGVGKSSVINLMAGKEVALTSPNLRACTLEAKQYWFHLPGETPLRIFDTVGLEEPEIGVNTFLGAIEKAHELVTSLHSAGGIDLLLFCVKGGRVTAAMQRTYRMFYEVLCNSHVPLAIVVTGLETEDVMENWWLRNEKTFLQYGIRSVAHACITSVSARVAMYANKRADSQIALRKMLQDILSNRKVSYVQDVRSWFTAVVQMLRSFLITDRRRALRRRRSTLTKKLEKRCMLPRSDAEHLAHILTGG